MTKRAKSSASDGNANQTPMFLTEMSSRRNTKMVSVRIDEALHDRFKKASELAEKNGYDLSMTTVVHKALEMAVNEAHRLAPTQEEMPLQ